MTDAPHVLVLGGGFVAYKTVRGLRGAIKRGDVRVTVVTRDNALVAHGLIAEMVTGRILPSTVLNPGRRVFAPAALHVAEIESIDVRARKVVTSRHFDGARFELDYDRAVIAVGSGENLDAYPGLAEHAFRLKSFHDCFRLKNHVIEMLELADIETDPDERRRLLTFFVAGGGFSGTELAGELADLLSRLTKREYRGIRRDECRVLVVHPGPTLLPELYGSKNAERPERSYPRLVEYAMNHARKLGVELMLETKVVGVTPTDVYLSNGENVPTRTIVSAVGSKAWPLLDQIPVPRDARGRLITDEFLRVDGRDDLWAGGDCAAVPHPKGGTCPPVALFALGHGQSLGGNLRRALAGKPLKRFHSDVLGQGISIGNRTAVGALKGIPLRGKIAWISWRSIIWARGMPTWDRRLRLLADWTIWPFVGRDIVQTGPSQITAFDVRHHVYLPGETIADSSRPVRLVHVIVEGSVEVVGSDDGAVLETIGPGDHLGRKWLERRRATLARANSLVRTVALQEDQANELQDVLLSTERIVARTELTKAVDLDALRRSTGE